MELVFLGIYSYYIFFYHEKAKLLVTWRGEKGEGSGKIREEIVCTTCSL